MTITDHLPRRRFLRDAALGSIGALLGSAGVLAARRRGAAESSADIGKPTRLGGTAAMTSADAGDVRSRVSHALSLAALNRHAQQAAESGALIPADVLCLDGITRVHGWMSEGDDILLLGSREPGTPALHLDDLVVALRSAYHVSDMYREAPGCSIDPRRGDDDPWSIQDVRVFGMPGDCAMAARFVSVDYELKQAAAGLVSIENVPSMCDLAKRGLTLCGNGESKPEAARELSHRLWFCASYPNAPRFVVEEDSALIEKAVGARVLTEEEFFDAKGARVGSGPPDAAAGAFVAAVSRLLAESSHPSFAALVADFRLIEAAKLLRITDDRVEPIAHLLEGHATAQARVPRYVAGVRRAERVEVTCGGEVTEREEAGRRLIESHVMSRSHEYRFEGGVTVDIELPADEPVWPASPATSALRGRVVQARPSTGALAWPVHA